MPPTFSGHGYLIRNVEHLLSHFTQAPTGPPLQPRWRMPEAYVARQWMALEYFKIAWKFQNKVMHVHGSSLEKGEFYFVVFES